MVRLDAGFGLEDVRPDGTLGQELDAFEFAGFVGEDVDELFPDDVSLLLGVGDTGEKVEEAVDRVDIDEVRLHLVAEDFDDLLGFAFAKQAVVDVDTDQLIADRLDEQGCHNRGVDAAGQGQQDFFVADLFLDEGDLLIDERLGELGGGDADHIVRSSDFSHRAPPENLSCFLCPVHYSIPPWVVL